MCSYPLKWDFLLSLCLKLYFNLHVISKYSAFTVLYFNTEVLSNEPEQHDECHGYQPNHLRANNYLTSLQVGTVDPWLPRPSLSGCLLYSNVKITVFIRSILSLCSNKALYVNHLASVV